MDYVYALILGIVQGLTEFLPVSSSGHLILFKHLFGMDTARFDLSFDIAVHVATLAAVCVVFRKKIWALLKKPFQKYTYMLVIATIPAVIVGLLFDDFIDGISQSGGFLGIAFLITAAVLLIAEKCGKRSKEDADIGPGEAAVIGIAQGIAVMPGISRSGSTLAAGMITGLKKETAMDFSFIMSIPIILGSAVLGVKDIVENPVKPDFLVLLIGMVAAGLSGYFAIKFMLDFFKKHSLVWFSVYVAAAGIFVLVDQLFIHNFFDTFLLG